MFADIKEGKLGRMTEQKYKLWTLLELGGLGWGVYVVGV